MPDPLFDDFSRVVPGGLTDRERRNRQVLYGMIERLQRQFPQSELRSLVHLAVAEFRLEMACLQALLEFKSA